MLARLRKQRRARAFLRDRTSVAALEFAIVLPLLLALLAGVYDISEAVIIRAEVYAAAESMVASASSLAVQQDGATALTYTQVQEVESLIWADVPSLRSGLKVNTPLSITMSSLLFYPKPFSGCKFNGKTSCNYIADVAWSESYVGAGGVNFDYADPTTQMVATDCDTNVNFGNQVSATAALSGYQNVTEFRTKDLTTSSALVASPNNTLANDAGIPPMLTVSIQYTYQPLFTLYLPVPYTFWVDAYWPVRSVKNTSATVNGFGDTVEPLVNQFTSMIGTSTTTPTTLNGTSINANASAFCINPTVTGSYTSNP